MQQKIPGKGEFEEALSDTHGGEALLMQCLREEVQRQEIGQGACSDAYRAKAVSLSGVLQGFLESTRHEEAC